MEVRGIARLFQFGTEEAANMCGILLRTLPISSFFCVAGTAAAAVAAFGEIFKYMQWETSEGSMRGTHVSLENFKKVAMNGSGESTLCVLFELGRLVWTRIGSLDGVSLYGPRVPGGTGSDPSREASRRTGGNLPNNIITSYRASTYRTHIHWMFGTPRDVANLQLQSVTWSDTHTQKKKPLLVEI